MKTLVLILCLFLFYLTNIAAETTSVDDVEVVEKKDVYYFLNGTPSPELIEYTYDRCKLKRIKDRMPKGVVKIIERTCKYKSKHPNLWDIFLFKIFG